MAIKQKSKVFNSKDLVAYFFVAGTGAFIQLLSSSLLKEWFGVSYGVSIVYSYLIGLVVGFVLTKLFAFNARQTNQTRREMIKFFMVALFSWGITVAVTLGAQYIAENMLHVETYRLRVPFGTKRININEMAYYLTGMGFSFISNYVLHKTFTFKSTGFYDRLKILLK